MESSIRKVLNEETLAGADALLATGIAMVIVGILAALAPLASGILFNLLVGAALIAAGIVELVDAFRSSRWQRGVLVALTGIVTLVAGVACILNPIVGLVALTVVFIGYLVLAGVFRMVLAFQLPSGLSGRFWTFLSGAAGLVLAFVALSQLPITSLWLIGTFVGASLLTGGIARISLARGLRRAIVRVDPPAHALHGAHA